MNNRAIIFDLMGVLYSQGAVREEASFVIDELRKKGFLIGAITNLSVESAQMILEQLEIKAYIIGAQVGLFKPNKQIYKLFLEQIEFEPKQCLIIDDNAFNLKPAKKLGMTTILFGRLDTVKEKFVDYQVSDLDAFLDLINQEGFE